MRYRIAFLLTAFAAAILCAQERTGHLDATPSQPGNAVPQAAPVGSAPTSYLLGPDDQVTLFVSDIEEISNKPMRIDMRGNLTLPLAGRLHAAGLTAGQLEDAIDTRLRKFLKDPEVVVSITEFRSQPVSVLGAVAIPGVHQLEGHKTLFQMLSMAGGLRLDAGNTVKITRGL